MGSLAKGLAEGTVVGFYTNQLFNKHVINLFLELLVFLTNRSPAVNNGGRNGIRHQRSAPI